MLKIDFQFALKKIQIKTYFTDLIGQLLTIVAKLSSDISTVFTLFVLNLFSHGYVYFSRAL